MKNAMTDKKRSKLILCDQTSDSEVEQLVQDVEKYTLASHLVWSLWGIISEHVNEIDFDYIEYARQRFQQYWLRKPELLGSCEMALNDVIDGLQDGSKPIPSKPDDSLFKKLTNILRFTRKTT
ncbi:hypothetical protein CFOL_v3_34353 [Cephalotus follicularis]|uniref:Uncharacterized protein n=1 Tax=Cephalotus follicularis TaxID=3775 RepID=A0A1Q3DF68_CEPFO|nr:hypothetical protein CFOL_v3_34353 [Cephalotus follicularis]